jgi:DNA-binding beta-propeller fold protein YncE
MRFLSLGLSGAMVCALAAGCSGAEGRAPEPERFYYPTGLLASPGRTTLFVANSDFDLQFSGGWVQAVDARALRAAVRVIVERVAQGDTAATACSLAGLAPNQDAYLNPGPCAPFESAPFVRNAALVGAFSSGLLLAHRPDGAGARLFAPVRGDPSITYFEVEDDRALASAPSFRLDCGGGEDGFCDDAHRLGRDPDRTLRGVQLPADPVGIAATPDGGAIVSAHQTQGAASLVINDWATRPELSYFLSGLPNGPTELATIPEPALVAGARAEAAAAGRSFDYLSGFVLTFRATAELDVLRLFPDSGSVPPRPFVTRAQALGIGLASQGFDSRGLAIVDGARRGCESLCAAQPAPLDCRIACALDVPLRLVVANRTPPSLLLGEVTSFVTESMPAGGTEPVLTSAGEDLGLFDLVPLDFGPSRVEVGRILDPSGAWVERVFAVCFDSRSIFIVDPDLGRVETVIRTGRGPHDIAVDDGVDERGQRYAFLYVGHFTDSYLGVVDLDMRRPRTYGQMFASVGIPTPPKESK